jgi:hypothetical protein
VTTKEEVTTQEQVCPFLIPKCALWVHRNDLYIAMAGPHRQVLHEPSQQMVEISLF